MGVLPWGHRLRFAQRTRLDKCCVRQTHGRDAKARQRVAQWKGHDLCRRGCAVVTRLRLHGRILAHPQSAIPRRDPNEGVRRRTRGRGRLAPGIADCVDGGSRAHAHGLVEGGTGPAGAGILQGVQRARLARNLQWSRCRISEFDQIWKEAGRGGGVASGRRTRRRQGGMRAAGSIGVQANFTFPACVDVPAGTRRVCGGTPAPRAAWRSCSSLRLPAARSAAQPSG